MWNKICAEVFSQIVEKLKKQQIKYFILRNYEGLPDTNHAKDVDIVVEPRDFEKAKKILQAAYTDYGLVYYYQADFHKLHCFHGISLENKTGIHIDLLEGYSAKGYEVFTFEELYQHTKDYKGMRVLEEDFDALMILVYKLFGYKTPVLKEKYREKLYDTCSRQKQEFLEQLEIITDKDFAVLLVDKILQQDFASVIRMSGGLTRRLKRYVKKKRPVKTLMNVAAFGWGKAGRILFSYKKYARVIGVAAPDGAGKTTFINRMQQQINYYYVNDPEDKRCDLRHFRPTVFPNLGAVGEKAGVMEQDRDWRNPHRNQPANRLSSFFRMAYYMADYIVGWQKVIRKNVQYDRFTIFDRYSYDFIVDPRRSKINLPKGWRKFLVSLTPKPQIMFLLQTKPETIYERKQELCLEEIRRQCREYEELAKKDRRFIVIDASKEPERMAEEAVYFILEKFTIKTTNV